MHIYTIQEAAHAVSRLVREGMALKHAVNVTAAAFGFHVDELYIEVARIID